MSKYNSIAVVYGSDSSEWEVSCRSGEYVASRIDEGKYDVYEIFARFGKWSLVAFRKRGSMRVPLPEGSRPEIDKTDFSFSLYGEKIKPEYVYIMQHGNPGENGLFQGYLEMLGIPFSSCSSFVSNIAFDKYACKSYVRDMGIVKCAPDVFVNEYVNTQAAVKQVSEKLRFPVFVKPTNGGSSFGITKVNEPGEVESAIKFAFSEGNTVIVEQGVQGRELTCGAYYDGTQIMALPIVEILTENEYFDYDAKYNGHSQEVCPANLTEEEKNQIQETTKAIYAHIGCSGVVRIDYILSKEGLYFLEANTIPGMTSASIVPKMVKAARIDITDFLSTIIESK